MPADSGVSEMSQISEDKQRRAARDTGDDGEMHTSLEKTRPHKRARDPRADGGGIFLPP